MEVQYIAYWLNGDGTQDLLHPDLPLHEVELTRDLGVGRMTAKFPPEMLRDRIDDGRHVLQEWATAIYVMVDGSLFDAYIVASLPDDDQVAQLDAVGWLGYLSGFPYRGSFNRRDIAAETGFREIVAGLDGWPGADIGFTTAFYGAFRRIGNPDPDSLPAIPALPPVPPPFKEAPPVKPPRPEGTQGRLSPKPGQKGKPKLIEYHDTEMGKYDKAYKEWEERRKAAEKAQNDYQQAVNERNNVLEQRERMLEDAAFKLNWWSTHDLLREFQSLLSEVDGQVKVAHKLSDDGTATHRIEVFGSAVRRNTNVELVDGENVIEKPVITRGGDKHGKTAVVIGAGEGPAMRRSTWVYEAGGDRGLQRVITHVDKSLRYHSQVSRAAERLVRRRRWWVEYGPLKVTDSGLAPIRDFDVGDEVMYRTRDRRGRNHSAWVLVTRIAISPDEGTAEISIEPIEEVSTS